MPGHNTEYPQVSKAMDRRVKRRPSNPELAMKAASQHGHTHSAIHSGMLSEHKDANIRGQNNGSIHVSDSIINYPQGVSPGMEMYRGPAGQGQVYITPSKPPSRGH